MKEKISPATRAAENITGNGVSSPTLSAPEARGARRKRETRARLLNAAMKLMAEKGMEGVAINEITEEADVGFGSFYNHFASKKEIYTALVDAAFEQFADALDIALAEIADPAESLAASIRHTIRYARQDPDWGRFLLREGLSERSLSHGLGTRLLRDIQKGQAAGRFSVDDPLIGFITVAGAVLVAISLDLQSEIADTSQLEVLDDLKVPSEDLPERVTTGLLAGLGISAAGARKIARLQLPEI